MTKKCNRSELPESIRQLKWDTIIYASQTNVCVHFGIGHFFTKTRKINVQQIGSVLSFLANLSAEILNPMQRLLTSMQYSMRILCFLPNYPFLYIVY